jgi:hypothetical protein
MKCRGKKRHTWAARPAYVFFFYLVLTDLEERNLEILTIAWRRVARLWASAWHAPSDSRAVCECRCPLVQMRYDSFLHRLGIHVQHRDQLIAPR